MRSSMRAFSLLICVMRLDAAQTKHGLGAPPLTKSSSTPNLQIWLTHDERSGRSDKPSERPKNEEKEESRSPKVVREPFPLPAIIPKKFDSLPQVTMGLDGNKMLHIREQGGTWNISSDSDQGLLGERLKRLSQEEIPDIRKQLKDLQQQVQGTTRQTQEVHKEVTGNVSPRLKEAHEKLDKICKVHEKEEGRYVAGVQNTQVAAGAVKKTSEEIKSDVENIKTILELLGKKMDSTMIATNKRFDELKSCIQAVDKRLVDTQETCMLTMEDAKRTAQNMAEQQKQLLQVSTSLQKIFGQGDKSHANTQKIINCLAAALSEDPKPTHETAKIDSSKKS